MNPTLSKKQKIALGQLFWENPVRFVFYGGAAGGGKSWLGCYWLMTMCWRFPNTRWFVGRDSLKDTRQSVLISFGKVAKAYNFNDWKYSDNEIRFSNGSAIVFLDLSYYPYKDPLFERLGSKEFTGGWIEEAGEVNFLAFDTLKTRVGRQNNLEYGIVPKILITANPKKNWLFTVFWKHFKANSLPKEYVFIRALYQDNPFLPVEYVENMKLITDKVKIERLLKGNFDYDDNPNSLCDYDSIMAIFGGNIEKRTGIRYLTADIARFGSDKAVIAIWDGLTIIDYCVLAISATTEIQQRINTYRVRYEIPKDRCVADDDGVGGGVVDNCGIKGFVNNSSPLVPLVGAKYDIHGKVIVENYSNLQSQCGYKLAEKINAREISFAKNCIVADDLKDDIALDLEQLQSYRIDDDQKLRIKPKAEIKVDIGRSPDWRDTLLMRMYFEYLHVDNKNKIRILQNLR